MEKFIHNIEQVTVSSFFLYFCETCNKNIYICILNKIVMKKLYLLLLCCLFVTFTRADEGMWLPVFLNYNEAEMQQLGFKLTAEDVYSVNHHSMKDAIVLFGGGCTAELVSSQGLLLTNHHCGYSYVQRYSTLEHNYLHNGFWAKSHEEEIPCEGLSVTFLVRE